MVPKAPQNNQLRYPSIVSSRAPRMCIIIHLIKWYRLINARGKVFWGVAAPPQHQRCPRGWRGVSAQLSGVGAQLIELLWMFPKLPQDLFDQIPESTFTYWVIKPTGSRNSLRKNIRIVTITWYLSIILRNRMNSHTPLGDAHLVMLPRTPPIPGKKQCPRWGLIPVKRNVLGNHSSLTQCALSWWRKHRNLHNTHIWRYIFFVILPRTPFIPMKK